MTNREDLRQRVELTIARNTFSKAAAAILVEIETTHAIVPRELLDDLRGAAIVTLDEGLPRRDVEARLRLLLVCLERWT